MWSGGNLSRSALVRVGLSEMRFIRFRERSEQELKKEVSSPLHPTLEELGYLSPIDNGLTKKVKPLFVYAVMHLVE